MLCSYICTYLRLLITL